MVKGDVKILPLPSPLYFSVTLVSIIFPPAAICFGGFVKWLFSLMVVSAFSLGGKWRFVGV